MVFQDLDDLENVVHALNPAIEGFDSSCFNGCYVTGDIDEGYLKHLERKKDSNAAPASQMEHSIRVDSLRE